MGDGERVLGFWAAAGALGTGVALPLAGVALPLAGTLEAGAGALEMGASVINVAGAGGSPAGAGVGALAAGALDVSMGDCSEQYNELRSRMKRQRNDKKNNYNFRTLKHLS